MPGQFRTVQDIIDAIDAIAPPKLALEKDPIGLHAGDRKNPVRRLALALDASLPTIAAARKISADMLVVHHPRFYGGLRTLASDDPNGRRAAAILEAGLAVYSAHTNLDMAPGGTNDLLATAAGLVEPRVVKPEREERLLKLAVFVPSSHFETVRSALGAAGAGAIGNYSDCSFACRGVGTFRGGRGAKPFIGKPGRLEEVEEYRLETVFGDWSRERMVAAMLAAHPYEEVAYDLYVLARPARVFGFGRAGDLPAPESLAALAARMARAVGSGMTQYSGDGKKKVRRAAVWAGAGVEAGDFLHSGAEAVVAGEVGYHQVETFRDAGVAVVTLGHGYSEELVLTSLAGRLKALLPGLVCKVVSRGLYGMVNVGG